MHVPFSRWSAGWPVCRVLPLLVLTAFHPGCGGTGEESPVPSATPAVTPTAAPVTQTPTGVTPTATSAPVTETPALPTLVPTPTLPPFEPPTFAGTYRFWVGELGPKDPLYSGPQQSPFICTTVESDLGQPVIDNIDGIGNAVYPEADGAIDYSARPFGWSRYCSIATRVDYWYVSSSDLKFKRLADRSSLPADVASLNVNGEQVPFVVRVEAGTINRFLYTIAMLAPFEESLETPEGLDNRAWNNRIVYYLRGGVGIGHYQGYAAWHGGVWGDEHEGFRRAMEEGYAIVTSSANETGVTYNLELAAETAWMVKEHFTLTYGAPSFTVGLGGSGGGVQQYIFGQNQPDILDAGIPLYSYPDMVTQAIPVGDCNLLEQYFMEETDAAAAAGTESVWAKWTNRTWVEGMNASDTIENSVFEGVMGSSECIEAWWFGEPLVLNPQFTAPEYIQALNLYGYPQAEISSVKWTHFNDLGNIYPIDARGFAGIPWDNVGVQYGLQAMRDHKISVDEFLRINACVGGWKEQNEYIQWDPVNDPFDIRNTTQNAASCREGMASPRKQGNIEAMWAAYESGQAFYGKLDMPVIDLRPYLEEELDMHNSRQSFSTRARLLQYDGDASNQVVWFTHKDDNIFDHIMDAIHVLEDYKLSGRKPVDFEDRCFDQSGTLIDSGAHVWAGILDTDAPGPCTQAYPIKSSPRMVAGEMVAGDTFKCGLKGLDVAFTDGTYGDVVFTVEQQDQLFNIFRDGVCDYSLPDEGLPLDLR